MDIFEGIILNFTDALLSIDRVFVEDIIREQKKELSPIQIAENIISPSLEKIGSDWESGKLSLSQVYMSGKICEELVNSLFLLEGITSKIHPKAAIVTLEDYHLLGKRIVLSMLRAGGYTPIDFGQMSVDNLVRKVQKEEIQILFISVLMLPSALKVEKVKSQLEQLNHKGKIIVGGAPFRFDLELWKNVGADAMGKTASDAICIMEDIIGGGK
ncbi:MAG: cobalamin B12-binding domain-containing protein [Leptospiraceae bacterium]|nr:cobalamin-dependent protein [Leptospiraceae bacterium]MCP5495481.1 cobalamin B12-binding domain-containing protein [Leptospiraceae bacterium]